MITTIVLTFYITCVLIAVLSLGSMFIMEYKDDPIINWRRASLAMAGVFTGPFMVFFLFFVMIREVYA